MIKKVLVGTDTSSAADLAVDHAASLARSYQADLTVLYVKSPVEARQVVDPKLAADPDRYLSRMPSRFSGISVRVRTEAGDAAEALCRVAEEERADVIVVGNRGLHGRRRGFLQSVPAAVARHSPCSVLIVDTRMAQ
jgi:nucleotide-binding universal stress UspA family protein